MSSDYPRQGWSSTSHDDPNQEASSYALLVAELLDTEQKYVKGLERFALLKHVVQRQRMLEDHVINEIFGNIDALLAFSETFLETLMTVATLPSHEQNWGGAFSTLKAGTDIYIAYIANHKTHMSAATRNIAVLSAAKGPPGLVDDIPAMHHTFQWPYARFVKYSVYLKALRKEAMSNEAKRADLVSATLLHNSALHKANEALNEQECKQAVAELLRRVDDWKGHRLEDFGNLLLFATLHCRRNAEEKEPGDQFESYLFENILAFCKRKSKNSNNPDDWSLRLRGRVYLVDISDIITTDDDDDDDESPHQITVEWKLEGDIQQSVVTFPNSELMHRWEERLRLAWDKFRLLR